MVAPVQEMMTPESSDAFQAMIIEEYGPSADAHGYSRDELLAAMPNSRTRDSEAVLDVGGMEFESSRYQVGALQTEDRSRGGLELSMDVTRVKVMGKAAGMLGKQLLAASPEQIASGEPIDTGGKGGIRATAEELEQLGREGRKELFRRHTEAHDINPFTNVTATDIGTFGPDMDAIAEGLRPQYGNQAGAAASGVSEKYGGEPDLHFPRTGLGAAIALTTYLEWRADQGDARVIEAMNGGAPLTLLQQGNGKAGSHFLANLPSYVQPKGLLERNGALVATQGDFLDRDQIAQLARETGLDEESQRAITGSKWLPPTERSSFWAMGADILGPAFDKNQVTREDVLAFEGMLVHCVANQPNTPEANSTLAELEIDSFTDRAVNIGGTLSSRLIGEKIMDNKGWSAQYFESSWRYVMKSVATTALRETTRLRQEHGKFVPIDAAVDSIIVDRAVQRLRAIA